MKIKKLAESNLKNNRKAVLGHFPENITNAKSLDASYICKKVVQHY